MLHIAKKCSICEMSTYIYLLRFSCVSRVFIVLKKDDSGVNSSSQFLKRDQSVPFRGGLLEDQLLCLGWPRTGSCKRCVGEKLCRGGDSVRQPSVAANQPCALAETRDLAGSDATGSAGLPWTRYEFEEVAWGILDSAVYF